MKRFAVLTLCAAACAPQPVSTTNSNGMAAIDNASDAPATADPVAPCDGSKANRLLGRTVDAAVRAEAMRLTGAKTVRVLAPGTMATMDYRTDRLNIETDGANKATVFRCG